MTAPDQPSSVSRRDLLMLAGGAVVGAGATGFAVGVASRSSSGAEDVATQDVATQDVVASGPTLRRFVSTDLTAPEVTTWTRAGSSPAKGYLFVNPRTDLSNGVVYDDAGEPVWIEPSGENVTDLRVQEYGGRPVLTHWSGKLVEGYGVGEGVILGSDYGTIATVRAGNGVQADLHEFVLTPRGTAWLLAYPVQEWDLRPIGGPEDGFILGSRIQEVDIATGEVLFDWDGMDHVDLGDTYQPLSESRDGATPESAFDPIHLNSIEEDGDTLLVSARHTFTIYSIDRSSGEIRWRLGGKRNDFDRGDGLDFSWQHDARRRSATTISLFDNHGSAGTDGEISSGMLIELDEVGMTARLAKRYVHREHFGFAQGNMQVLDDGNVLIGWGSDPAATEFTPDGDAVFELRDAGSSTYRFYRAEWTGRPPTRPDIGVRSGADAVRVYASWNGSTDVASWRFLAGDSQEALGEIDTVPRDGFETSADVTGSAFVQVQALDATGAVLGASMPLAV